MSLPVICLMGPTASGKTDLACELVELLPLEIISVDSAMVYRHMDIGTAKPSDDLLKKIPHHLIDLINPNESYSVAQFCKDAIQAIKMIRAKNKIPLLVGGTMMYFKALQQGLSQLPVAHSEIREAILADADRLGWPELHNKLVKVDPQSGVKIHPNDSQRIQRALEVFYVSGRPLSDFLEEAHGSSQDEYINFMLMPQDRAWLHARIAKRFKMMLEEGLIEETRQLLQTWHLTQEYPAMRCVGYRQVMRYLQNDDSFADMENKGIAATRQLAKRQLTWMRHWPNGDYLEPERLNHEMTINHLKNCIQRHIST